MAEDTSIESLRIDDVTESAQVGLHAADGSPHLINSMRNQGVNACELDENGLPDKQSDDSVINIESADGNQMQMVDLDNGESQTNVNVNNNATDLCTKEEKPPMQEQESEKSPNVQVKKRSRRKSSTISRFSVEPVSVQSSPKDISISISETNVASSPSKSSLVSVQETSLRSVTFFHPEDDEYNVSDDDIGIADLDDVFDIGSDNQGYASDTASQNSGGSFRRCHSHPHMTENLKHVPALRRCYSKNDMKNEARQFRARDSVKITKHHLKHRPRYMKYDDIHRPKKHVIPLTARPVKPNDFMHLSCIVMLCCNLPIGCIALYYAARSNKTYESGDYDIAKKSSRLALVLSLIGVFVTVLVAVVALWVMWPDAPQRQINR